MQTSSTYNPRRSAPVPAEVIDRLFNRLIAFYGTKFLDAYAGISMGTLKEVWAEELSTFTPAELNAGVNGCRQRQWPPTLPEFLNLCRPPLSPEATYHEAVEAMRVRTDGHQHAYSHPAVYWAFMEIGPWDLTTTPHKLMAGRWAECVQRHFAKGAWPDVPPPPERLPPPEVRGPNPEQRAAIAALLSGIHGGRRSDDRHPVEGRAA